MADKPSASSAAAADAVAAGPSASTSNEAGSIPKPKPKPEGNPAFRMMGLPRLRLPSRNWLIFLTVTGSFASAVFYDKYQTRRMREKWCKLVSHIPKEHLDPKSLPRKVTIYLAGPPGDGLRTAREHFHDYVKPVLVAAALDWDVVEGRKEGDVRHKTAERIRKKRKRDGEGAEMSQEEMENNFLVDAVRERAGTHEFQGIAGDIVVGRNTWKEYIRGLHEGWLGPPDPPTQPDVDGQAETEPTKHTSGQSSLGDTAVKAAVNTVAPPNADASPVTTLEAIGGDQPVEDASPTAEPTEEEKKKAEEEEKPKPRQPPPYILSTEYSTATPSPHIPELLGPSIGIRFPHILGFRNTPIRIYRFLTRRHLQDSVGRDVAAAVLASYRPYTMNASGSDDGDVAEQAGVLEPEEQSWWKTTFQPRKEHEESVWIEEIVLDERITNRMRAFQLTAEDEDRAKRIAAGTEKVASSGDEER